MTSILTPPTWSRWADSFPVRATRRSERVPSEGFVLMRACRIVLLGTALCSIASCSAPATSSSSSPERGARELCTEVVASTQDLSSTYWDHSLAEKRLPELLDEHGIPHELDSGEWRLLVLSRSAVRARELLGAAIDKENLAARLEPADPAVKRPYELPSVVIARWDVKVEEGPERFPELLRKRLGQEKIPRFDIGTGGVWKMHVRADKAEAGRKIAAEIIAVTAVPAVVVRD
jgi:hypothetical protein